MCSVLFIDWSKESVKSTYENWKEKKDLEKYFKPNPSIVKKLPIKKWYFKLF